MFRFARFRLLRLWCRVRTGCAVFATYVTFVAWWLSGGVYTAICGVIAGAFWLLSKE